MKPKNLEKAVKKYGYVFLQGRLQQCYDRLLDSNRSLFGWRRDAVNLRAMIKIQKVMNLLWFYFG